MSGSIWHTAAVAREPTPAERETAARAGILNAIAGVTASIASLVQNDQRLSAQERILTANEWASTLMRGEQANQVEASGSYQLLQLAERERQVAIYNAEVAARKIARLAEIDRLQRELAALTAQMPVTSDPAALPAPAPPSEASSHAGLFAALGLAVVVTGGAVWFWRRSQASSPSPHPRRKHP